eukprot:CAMPEP_0171964936 /NCGR_PEP_ID=MMETSP0993-20121228/184370_1 /TAXON_ID=483369 /ORGANISM="non described non described, Strain CCMP2098" /LENGTH=49 /DNA_ID=CAMNT_0012613893 /DNA_START=37 /DNA_END=186 /DNA_ORIENTATION=-
MPTRGSSGARAGKMKADAPSTPTPTVNPDAGAVNKMLARISPIELCPRS